MEYRAVGNRLAVCLADLKLPISDDEILAILLEKGFSILDVDIVSLARSRVGVSTYRRGASPSEAPEVVDCSGLMRWLFAKRGIWLPRRSIQQMAFGGVVAPQDIMTGDLVFASGFRDYFLDDMVNGVGHVALVTDTGTVIKAANSKRGVVEDSLHHFVNRDKFRGARRYFSAKGKTLTLEIPTRYLVETTDDLRWVVRSALKV